MVGRGSFKNEVARLARALLLASALLLGAPGAAAFAQDDEELRLVKVTSSSAAAIQQLESRFDVGYIGEPTEAAVYLTESDEALLRAEGYKVGVGRRQLGR
jgi:hypothetical protein